MDASKMGSKIKEGKNQKTILSLEEIEKIQNYFIEKKEENKFSVLVSNEEIKEKNYSFLAGQYFGVNIKFEEITLDQFNEKMKLLNEKISSDFYEYDELQKNIIKDIESLKYEE